MKPHPLKVEREQRGWSQARVAEAVGVSTQTVIRWEQRRAIPYPYYREQLAQLFARQSLALTALDGLPGVGKTALAVAVSLDAAVQAHFADGILWAGLGPHPDR